MNRGSIEQRYKVYERHFEKAKADAKKYFKSGSFGVYRKLDEAQFEEIYNEFYKGNKNYARQIIYDFNKEARYSDKQADNAAQMLYNFVNGNTPDNLKNILSVEDIDYIKSFLKSEKTEENIKTISEKTEENIKTIKDKILRGKFYDQLKKIYDKIEDNPEFADKGTVEYNYLFGSL